MNDTQGITSTARPLCNGDDSVSPVLNIRKISTEAGSREYTTTEGGLTKREYFAAMAMQGILTHRPMGVLPNFAAMADDAVHQADVLIEALNNKEAE